MVKRPTCEAPTMPMRLPTLPTPRRLNGSLSVSSRIRSRNSNAPLFARMIIATVNSATGTAFAAAAEVTTMPRCQTSSVTCHLTVPAAYANKRRCGARSSTSRVSGGQPQWPNSISASRKTSADRSSSKSVSGSRFAMVATFDSRCQCVSVNA